LIRHLSPPGVGLAPYLWHRLATSLIAPLVLYGADLFTPSTGTMAFLNPFWHKVQRWTINCFSPTPTGILFVKSGVPPVALLFSQRERLAPLMIVCSPGNINAGRASFHSSFPSLTVYWAPDSLRAVTKGLKSVYLPLNCKMPCPAPPIRNHLQVDMVSDRTIRFTQGCLPRSWMPVINSHLVSLTLTVSPLSLMDNTYSSLKRRVREALPHQLAHLFPKPGYYHHPPSLNQRPFMGMGKLNYGANPQVTAGKSWPLTLPGGPPMLIPATPAGVWSQKPSNMPSTPSHGPLMRYVLG